MIPTYAPRADYLEQVLDGVLTQDWGSAEVQIELVDDSSPTFDPVVFLERRGDSRFTCYRQPQHAGIAGNWNTCIARARGHWVHILHQDDLVLPGFYERLREGITAEPDVGAAFCQAYEIDDEGCRHGVVSRVSQAKPGLLSDWIEHIFVGLSIQTPSIVVNRSVYEHLGGFNSDFRYVLDWDMWKRIAVQYPIWYDPKPLASYRKHRSATTTTLQRSGENVVEIRRSIEASAAYLPWSIVDEVSERARAHHTRNAIGLAWKKLSVDRDVVTAWAQLRGAHRLHSSKMFVKSAFTLARRAWHRRRMGG